jgi:hypothetical protein
MTSPLRIAYRAILHLHPVGFRAEFGDEMLWIFDEESSQGRALHVLLDGLRSIVVQSLRPQTTQIEAAGPIYTEIDSSLPSERFAQATLVTLFCSLSLTFFVSMVVPRVAIPLSHMIYTHIRLLAATPAPQPPRHVHTHFSGEGR